MSDARVSGIRKKKIGRPKIGSVGVMLRLPPELLAALDRFRGKIGRQAAIRFILEEELPRRIATGKKVSWSVVRDKRKA